MFLRVLIVAVILSGAIAKPTQYAPARLKLDLSMPPEHRFDHIVPMFLEPVGVLIDGFKAKLPPLAFEALSIITSQFERFISQPYVDEMRGLARASGYPIGDIILLNVFYELVAGCTSIIAYNQGNNSAVHARNLDFPIDHLGPVTIDFDVFRNGTYLYSFTTFAGYVGVLTGMKPPTEDHSGWTFSLNERMPDGFPWSHIANLVEALIAGGVSSSLHVRRLMDRTGTREEMSYATAILDLSRQHFVAPSYLIVGSADGGVVITRDRNAAADLWHLPKTGAPPALVQTNYDRWVKPPADDNRVDPAYAILRNTSSRGYGTDFLLRLLRQSPMYNYMTVYTTFMELATRTYGTVVWTV